MLIVPVQRRDGKRHHESARDCGADSVHLTRLDADRLVRAQAHRVNAYPCLDFVLEDGIACALFLWKCGATFSLDSMRMMRMLESGMSVCERIS
jgi:hypothetical protein